jgi:hypothetical protein
VADGVVHRAARRRARDQYGVLSSPPLAFGPLLLTVVGDLPKLAHR